MRDLPYAEALVLLSRRHTCPDALPWEHRGPGPMAQEAGAGLLDAAGNPAGLYANMKVGQLKRTALWVFKFSVFRLSSFGTPERVYQLEVVKWPRLPADLHSHPHEHVGDRRERRPEWLEANYDALVASFCRATNIEFVPPLDEDPTEFRLKP